MALLVPNMGIFIISWYFAIRQIWGCWFQIWQYFFQVLAQKYSNHTFLFFFCEICNQTNLRVLISVFFQITAQKYLNKAFFDPKFKDFYFCTKLCNKKNSRTLIWNMTIIFSHSTPKICKLGIFGPKFKDFYFPANFVIRQVLGCWFQIWQWLFRILAWKYPNK